MPPEPPQPQSDDTSFDDDKTARAIDDIVAKEADTVLGAEDEKSGAQAQVPVHKKHRFFYKWWHNKWARWLTVLVLLGATSGCAATPVARYWVLNTAGVRVESSVKVLDGKTGLPLKSVRFVIDGKTADTDVSGEARLRELALGPHSMRIEQPGFKVIEQHITLGWGSNPLGVYRLEASGVSYVIELQDRLTQKPLAGVQAVNGEATALSDKNGKLTITLPSIQDAADPVTLNKSGYRTEQVMLDVDARKATKTSMVAAHKTVFVSKQSGKYDVYKSDLDGKNAQVLLAGTGSETANISLAVSPDGSKVAVVSTRDGQRDGSGQLLSSLLIVNMSDGNAVSIAKASQIQLIDWVGQRVIFEQVSSEPTTPANARYSVVSYNISDGTRIQLGAAKKLNAVFSAQGVIFYAVAADPADSAFKPAFYKVHADGGGKQAVVNAEIWSGQRVDYHILNLQHADGGWLAYDLRTDRTNDIIDPVSYAHRPYADNTSGSRSLWVETKDGQGVLELLDVAANKPRSVVSVPGLTYPVRWVTDEIIMYRVVTGGEVADYAVSLAGGPALKIADVVNSYGYSSGQ